MRTERIIREQQLRMDYKILIADDEPEIRNLLRLYLKMKTIIVIAKRRTDSGRSVYWGKSSPALCIFIMMPKPGNYHVLRKEIRKRVIFQ